MSETKRNDVRERIGRYLAWMAVPEFELCPRCHAKGFHHGDWCTNCSGLGEIPTEAGMWSADDLLAEAMALIRALDAGQQEGE
jgi:hypothetical protein